MSSEDPRAQSPEANRSSLPGWLIPPFLFGATLALAGGFWDDAWHTERGRDSFFIAPHLAIYGGISLAGGALGLWLLLVARDRGLREVLADRALLLALISMGVTLASAPVDNFWHVAFGRDAVIWSPPHVLGIVGTAGLSVAILVELTETPASWAPPLRWVAGALLLAALSFLVVEYDTDVPQFATTWYLPVLALVSSFALGLVRLATGDRWAATRTAACHLLYFLLVAAFLAVEGFDLPKAPLILPAAVALDLAARRRLPLPIQAAVYTAVLYALYVPSLDLIGGGVRLDGMDLVVGLPLSYLGVLTVLGVLFLEGPHQVPKPRLALSLVLALAVSLLVTPAAVAHDPGQGEPAGTFDFAARLDNETLNVTALRADGDCGELAAQGLVARRAGEVERAPLRRSGCSFEGAISLPQEGRWFIYLDVTRAGETIESWIPVKVGEGPDRFTAGDRYAYLADRKPATAAKVAIAVVMYGLVIAFLAAIVLLVRSTARRRSPRTQPA